MNQKQPLENGTLTTMLVTGAALLLLGLFIWLGNTDLDYDPSSLVGDYDESNLAGQFFGTAVGMASLLLVVLGWTAAAICRQIADTTHQPED